MWNSKTVSIVLPAYNEEKYIRPAVEDFFASGIVDEVIVVDNNSRPLPPPCDRGRDARARRAGERARVWSRVEARAA